MGPPALRKVLLVGILVAIPISATAWMVLQSPSPAPAAGGNEWTNQDPIQSPSPRRLPAMVYDSLRHRVVLFGGMSGTYELLNDTWVYDFGANSWIDVTVGVAPPAMMERPRMIYDSGSDRILLFGVCGGACGSQTWAYDPGTGTWTQQPSAPEIMYDRSFSIAYDPLTDRVLRFGGGTFAPHFSGLGSNATWVYDTGNGTWSLLSPARAPPRRWGAQMAFDEGVRRVVLFGGCLTIENNDFSCLEGADTWSFDFAEGDWSPLDTETAPPRSEAMVYDSTANRLIIYTGNETWTLDRTTNRWIDQSPSMSPPIRFATDLVYDSFAQRAIVFGGSGSGGVLGDTWTYEYGPVTPSVPSAPRDLQALPGATEVALQWRAPSDNGRYPIMGYRVYRGIPPDAPSLLAEVGVVSEYSDSGLTTGVTYEYEVSAVNIEGEGPRSDRASGTPPDLVHPTISILSPRDEEVLPDRFVTVSGTASDDQGVEVVEVSLNGGPWVPATGTTSWSIDLTVDDGRNNIKAAATDSSGNPSVAQINVTYGPSPVSPVLREARADTPMPNAALPLKMGTVLLVSVWVVASIATLGLWIKVPGSLGTSAPKSRRPKERS